MSNKLKRLFGSSSASINIVVLSEGFTNETQFNQALFELWNRFINYYPFTALRYHNTSVSLHSYFQANINFQTSYDAGLGKLVCNLDLLDSFLANCKIYNNGKERDLIDFLFKGKLPIPSFATIVLVLLPTTNPINLQAECENQIDDHYYSVFTTTDGFFEQVLIRAIGKVIGLGNEFEVSNTTPTVEEGKLLHYKYPNLYYIENSLDIPKVSDKLFKWKIFFNSNLSSLNLVPNTSLNLL
jgi:hypothetical protein